MMRKENLKILWDMADRKAQRLWDEGYFDKRFGLTYPRIPWRRSYLDTVEICDDGGVMVNVFEPAHCACCAPDSLAFSIDETDPEWYDGEKDDLLKLSPQQMEQGLTLVQAIALECEGRGHGDLSEDDLNPGYGLDLTLTVAEVRLALSLLRSLVEKLK